MVSVFPQFEGMDISWLHIVDVYNWDLQENNLAPGLRFLHKLKEEHIKLSPRLRMKVKLAAQVTEIKFLKNFLKISSIK